MTASGEGNVGEGTHGLEPEREYQHQEPPSAMAQLRVTGRLEACFLALGTSGKWKTEERTIQKTSDSLSQIKGRVPVGGSQ